MEITEEMYVRIKNEAGYCAIGKIENINEYREPSMKYCIDIQSDDFIFIPIEMIAKASYEIIDLIEAGDYVNGHLVKAVYLDSATKYIKLDNSYEIYCEDIKTIITKEQFEQMKYSINE